MTTPKELRAIRAQYLGITEKPPGSNRTRIGEEYGWNGVPYCAEGTSVTGKKAGLKPNVDFPWSASVAVCRAWYKKHGQNIARKKGRDGDQFMATISHTGWLEGSLKNGRYPTWEANTSPGTSGSQRDGGGVYRRSRPLAFIKQIGRPDYAAAQKRNKTTAKPAATSTPAKATPAVAEPVKGILGMTGYEHYSYAKDQRVKAKSRARILTKAAEGKKAAAHIVASPKRKGQKFLLQIGIAAGALPAGADVKAQVVLVRYVGGKPTIHRPAGFEQVSFPAGTGGYSAISLVLPERMGYTPKKGETWQYQVEIANYSQHDVTIKRVSTASFYE